MHCFSGYFHDRRRRSTRNAQIFRANHCGRWIQDRRIKGFPSRLLGSANKPKAAGQTFPPSPLYCFNSGRNVDQKSPGPRDQLALGIHWDCVDLLFYSIGFAFSRSATCRQGSVYYRSNEKVRGILDVIL